MTDLPFPRVTASAAADSSVRAARPQDALGVADVQLAVWRAAYAEVLPEVVDLDRDDVAEQWRRSIPDAVSSHHLVLVALEGPAVVGFLVAAPLPEGARPAQGEIADLLVHPEHTRRGHGSRLLAAGVDLLRQRGDREVLTWCGQDDAPRRTFLESAGFAADGVRRTLDMGPGTPALSELRLTALLD